MGNTLVQLKYFYTLERILFNSLGGSNMVYMPPRIPTVIVKYLISIRNQQASFVYFSTFACL